MQIERGWIRVPGLTVALKEVQAATLDQQVVPSILIAIRGKDGHYRIRYPFASGEIFKALERRQRDFEMLTEALINQESAKSNNP